MTAGTLTCGRPNVKTMKSSSDLCVKSKLNARASSRLRGRSRKTYTGTNKTYFSKLKSCTTWWKSARLKGRVISNAMNKLSLTSATRSSYSSITQKITQPIFFHLRKSYQS